MVNLVHLTNPRVGNAFDDVLKRLPKKVKKLYDSGKLLKDLDIYPFELYGRDEYLAYCQLGRPSLIAINSSKLSKLNDLALRGLIVHEIFRH